MNEGGVGVMNRGADVGSRPVRRGVVFAIVALTLLMVSIDSTIVATALHALQNAMDTTVNWAGWTLTSYSFGYALMLPISGALSERYGRRRVFLGSVIAFTAASLLCGLADNIAVLIALRAIQAGGGAGFMPSATAIIVDYFGDARDRAVSLFGSILPIGAMIGPLFGGLFVTYWSWRGVFFVNVPLGIAVVAAALRYIPRDPIRRRAKSFRLDIAGMVMLGSGLLMGMLAVSHLGGADVHLLSLSFMFPAIVSIGSVWMFLRHIARTTAPFISPELIRGPNFGAVNLVNVIYTGMTLGAVALIPLYGTTRYHLNAFDSGTLLLAQGIASVVVSLVAALTLRRTGHRLPLYVGSIIVVGGMVLLAVPPAIGISPHAWLATAAGVTGIGIGAINPASRNAGLQLAPERSSTLAALRSLALQIGSIITVSTTTAILSSVNVPGMAQAWVYAVMAVMFVAALPLISRIPEHHGSW
ncbi:MAG: MFS transporter [Opitutaceae bacterium]|nr:MFS transporter [Opitutaceae bacterium]